MRRRKYSIAKSLAWASIFAILVIQAAAGHGQQLTATNAPTRPALKIGPGDLLEISIFEDPELSAHVRVDEKGDIVIPLLGRLHVAGLSAEEANALVEERYVAVDILKPSQAHAMVTIVEYATQGITVNGEVKSPGIYPALGIRNLNDVITSAGGVTQFASSTIVIIHRGDPDHPERIGYNPLALSPELPQQEIFPGDTIMVPRAGVVYVLGAVNHVGGFELQGRNTLTVEEAMAYAGGSGRAASLRHAQLVRTLKDGSKVAIAVPIDLIFKGKASDLVMQDGDVLYVPSSRTAAAAQQAIQSALGIGTSIAVYRIANR